MNRSEDEEFDTWLEQADADLTASVEADLDAEAALTRIKQRTAARPRIFVSSASVDRRAAELLRQHLSEAGSDAFLDEVPATPEEAVAQTLTESDYYVLLWSEAFASSPWMKAEFTAALARTFSKRGSFLFIVRLDDSPLPPLLAERRCLDVVRLGWQEVAAQLARAWHRDRAVGLPVRPAPHPNPQDVSSSSLYVRSRDLGVAFVVSVPAQATGSELMEVVRTGLALPDVLSALDDAISMRVEYRLTYQGEPIPALAPLHLPDGATIDLEMAVESTGPRGPYSQREFRDESPSDERLSLAALFSHLTPKR